MRDYMEQLEPLSGRLYAASDVKDFTVGNLPKTAAYESLYISKSAQKKNTVDNRGESPERASELTFEGVVDVEKASATSRELHSSFDVIFKQLDTLIDQHKAGDSPHVKVEKASAPDSDAADRVDERHPIPEEAAKSIANDEHESDDDLQPLRILPSRDLFFNAFSGELRIHKATSLYDLNEEESVTGKCLTEDEDTLQEGSLRESSSLLSLLFKARRTAVPKKLTASSGCATAGSLPDLHQVGTTDTQRHDLPSNTRRPRASSTCSFESGFGDGLKLNLIKNKSKTTLTQRFSLPEKLGTKFLRSSLKARGHSLEEIAKIRKISKKQPQNSFAPNGSAVQVEDKSRLRDSEQQQGLDTAQVQLRIRKGEQIRDLTKRHTMTDFDKQINELAYDSSALSIGGSRKKSESMNKNNYEANYIPMGDIERLVSTDGMRSEYLAGLSAADKSTNEMRNTTIDNGLTFTTESDTRQYRKKIGGDPNSTSIALTQSKHERAVTDIQVLRSNLAENMSLSLNAASSSFLRHQSVSLQLSKEKEHYRSHDVLSRGVSEHPPSRNSQITSVRSGRGRVNDADARKRHSDATLNNLPHDYLQYSPRTLQRMLNSGIAEDRRVGDSRRSDAASRDPPRANLGSTVSVPNTRSSFQRDYSKARDQAQRSSFDKYLRGSSTNMSRGSFVGLSDNGYGGSGGTSPRDIDSTLVASGDRLSSRSDSLNSRSSSALASVDSGVRMSFTGSHNTLVVVAIDFGTTFSGYAFSFTRDPSSIHMMRKWEGGDPGVTNQKTPTSLLLKPDGSFRAFGFGARDVYHDLDKSEAKKWLFFDKFKMKLHSSTDLHRDMEIRAANGKLHSALKVFSHSLRFFRDHVLAELSDQSTAKITEEDITWVITVPAIWRQPAKQFMRTAAYEAGIASAESADRLLIALEPEAASIYCRKLRIRDCVMEDDIKAKSGDDSLISDDFSGITQYLVVDCGGGTVDLTVHELDVTNGTLKELHKGTGGPSGATAVDREFEKLMKAIFDADFIERFKLKRPASWVGLMIAFEAKKRTARPNNTNALNITLPFSFIEYHKKKRKLTVESAVKKFKNPDVKWSQEGFLRLSSSVMQQLFDPVLSEIVGHIQDLLSKSSLRHVEYMFLVGGFAESPLLQHFVRDALEGRVRVIIPNDVGLAILKGAVLFGLDPTVVRVRRSAFTYGVGVLNKFDPGKHDDSKRVAKDGVVWCKDIFDCFVRVDESVGVGEHVTRSYAPARSGQKSTVINVYCTEKPDVTYTTEKDVFRCGKLRIEMPDVRLEDIPAEKRGKPRELQATMTFGDTEIKVSAVDMLSGEAAKAIIDFLNY